MDISEYKDNIAFQITENWENWEMQSDKLKDVYSDLTHGDLVIDFMKEQMHQGTDDHPFKHEIE